LENKSKQFERRDYKYKKKFAGWGKSYFTTDCPFCGTENKIYNWSLRGSGKRCVSCKSLFTFFACVADHKSKFYLDN
jgi:transposase-like protein